MRDIIVFLNGLRGLEVVKKLKEFEHHIKKIIIPSEKKFDQIENEVKKFDINYSRIEDVNNKDVISKLEKLNPKLFIIAGYSTIFKQDLINVPLQGTINLHAGKLPEYRGGSPLNWQIINGETKATISVIKIDQGIDTGQVLQEQDILIDTSSTIKELHNQANQLFPQLVINVINKFEKTGEILGRIQDEKKATYWHQRSDKDGHLNFEQLEVAQVHRLVRALTKPYPGAWAFLEEKKVRIFNAETSKLNLTGTPGKICYVDNNGPYVICKDKAILIKEYLIENNTEMKLKQDQFLT